MLNKDEVNFIIYNNRSIKLVEQFLPNYNFDINEFIKLENIVKFIRSLYNSQYTVEINIDELNITDDDIIYNINDLYNITDIILDCNKNIKDYKEYQYLIDRGITDEIIFKYKLGAVSHIKERKVLDILGITHHPILNKIFDDGIDGGIILIPFFNIENKLINCTCRRISDIGKLKYTMACPEIDVYGIDDINIGDDIWMTEGIFDTIALKEQNLKCISVSSASWSTIQLYQIINKKPNIINIFSDYDHTGLKTSKMLQRIFNFYNIKTNFYISSKCKDASEHFLLKKYNFNDVEKIAITPQLLEEVNDDSIKNINLNFLDYLKNRTF